MIELDFKLKSEKAQKRFERLANKITDLRPIWKQFIPLYKELVEKEFDSTKGKIMQGRRWDKLSPQYRVQKRRKFGNKPLLVATGLLKERATNFETKLGKKALLMRVKGKKYFEFVHDKRAYFHTPKEPKETLPMRAWRFLIDIVERELESE